MSEPVDPREQFAEHGEWDALAVGWALSALDAEDEVRFADHLPGCAQCTATVRESLYTVADLAYALPDEAPPPALKSRLMAAVGTEPRTIGPAPEPDVPPATEPDVPAPEIPPAAEPQVPVADEPGVPVAGEPEPTEEWPLGEPYPGSPGDGIDWFAKPPRSTWRPADEPAVGERHPGPAPGEDVDQPTTETRRADIADLGPAGDEVEEPPPPAGYRGGDLEEIDRTGTTVVPLAPGRRRLARRVGIGVAVAAALALLAGLLAWNASLRSEQDDLRQIVAQRGAAIRQLTADSPARVAALTADGRPSPERRATLVVRGDQVEIIIETLGATTGNQTYWLWTLRCDTPQPTDLKPIRGFTVTQSKFSVRDIGSDPGVADAPCFAISSELGSATPKAPRQVVAVGQPE